MTYFRSSFCTALLALSTSLSSLAQVPGQTVQSGGLLAGGHLSESLLFGQALPPAIAAQLDACNVSWDVPGPTSAESMPIGNGDIGLNVWAESNGGIDFYIGKTDAWSERNISSEGLLKLGLVQVSLSPTPLSTGTPFLQLLKLRSGQIEIQYGTAGSIASFRVWVDANHPVIHVEATSGRPRTMTVHLSDWRNQSDRDISHHEISPDIILSGQPGRIVWYHRNSVNADPHLRNITSGGVIKGDHLISKDDTTLVSSQPATFQVASIYPFTATTATADDWLAQLNSRIPPIDAIPIKEAFAAHKKWWEQFWGRSWIFVHGDARAEAVNRGYTLQRFINACGGRGAYPIKFNGSIFVVDNPDFNRDKRPSVNADYRAWGGQYWFQNTRLIYWPMLAQGDFDLMQPLFRMYTAQLTANATQVKNYYHHDGSYIAETAPFWGGLQYAGPETPGKATLHYFTPVLELSMMMLDYYRYTGDEKFAKDTLLPTALTGLLFFEKHFGRDAEGKILLDPDNAIETYHKAHDPSTDIGGLIAVTERLLELPDSIVDAATRRRLLAFQKIIPPLPTGVRNGKMVLLPYADPPTIKRVGPENPALYAIFPFRLYGLGRPGFQMAMDTFNARLSKGRGGWSQEPIHSAMMGLTDLAKSYVVFNFANKDPRQKFPAFWVSQQDYVPNQCNGGAGEMGLEKMLMQADRRTILLFPAWPKNWDADFKLHAPGPTMVQGSIKNGKVVNLVVTPSSHAPRVIDLSGLSAPTDTVYKGY